MFLQDSLSTLHVSDEHIDVVAEQCSQDCQALGLASTCHSDDSGYLVELF